MMAESPVKAPPNETNIQADIKKKLKKMYSEFKECVVPSCSNTTKNQPDKLFIRAPSNMKMRQKWANVLKIKSIPNNSRYCCCEDHFNLAEDASNWMFYKTMGKVLYLKPDVVPHKYLNSPKTKLSTSQLSESERKRKKEFLLSLKKSAKKAKKTLFQDNKVDKPCSPNKTNLSQIEGSKVSSIIPPVALNDLSVPSLLVDVPILSQSQSPECRSPCGEAQHNDLSKVLFLDYCDYGQTRTSVQADPDSDSRQSILRKLLCDYDQTSEQADPDSDSEQSMHRKRLTPNILKQSKKLSNKNILRPIAPSPSGIPQQSDHGPVPMLDCTETGTYIQAVPVVTNIFTETLPQEPIAAGLSWWSPQPLVVPNTIILAPGVLGDSNLLEDSTASTTAIEEKNVFEVFVTEPSENVAPIVKTGLLQDSLTPILEDRLAGAVPDLVPDNHVTVVDVPNAIVPKSLDSSSEKVQKSGCNKILILDYCDCSKSGKSVQAFTVVTNIRLDSEDSVPRNRLTLKICEAIQPCNTRPLKYYLRAITPCPSGEAQQCGPSNDEILDCANTGTSMQTVPVVANVCTETVSHESTAPDLSWWCPYPLALQNAIILTPGVFGDNSPPEGVPQGSQNSSSIVHTENRIASSTEDKENGLFQNFVTVQNESTTPIVKTENFNDIMIDIKEEFPSIGEFQESGNISSVTSVLKTENYSFTTHVTKEENCQEYQSSTANGRIDNHVSATETNIKEEFLPQDVDRKFVMNTENVFDSTSKIEEEFLFVDVNSVEKEEYFDI